MGAPLALVGQRFGRLVVTGVGTKSPAGARRWSCICDCGSERIVDTSSLRGGVTVSCGCFHKERASALSRTHGATGTPEYKAWRAIKERCFNEKSKVFENYGGRGITMCDRWRDSFDAFLSDMGKRPTPKHSIDRTDNDLGYEPHNCRWATMGEQANNKRSNISVTINGVRRSFKNTCEFLNINVSTARWRFKNGSSLAGALKLSEDGVITMTRRSLDWSAVLRDLKADRLAAQPVREERLRTAQGLRGTPALALSAWRSKSGRRYVVGIHPIDTFDLTDAEEAVVLFVRRGADGISTLLHGANNPEALDAGLLVTLAKLDGCNEIHVHRLAQNAAERAAILTDLAAPAIAEAL